MVGFALLYKASAPSPNPSPSVSATNGLVPAAVALTNTPELFSAPSLRPSPSVSAMTGLVPVFVALTQVPVLVSTPSRNPSASVSLLVGLVAPENSAALANPSLSASPVAVNTFRSAAKRSSHASGNPSLSVSFGGSIDAGLAPPAKLVTSAGVSSRLKKATSSKDPLTASP